MQPHSYVARPSESLSRGVREQTLYLLRSLTLDSWTWHSQAQWICRNLCTLQYNGKGINVGTYCAMIILIHWHLQSSLATTRDTFHLLHHAGSS